MTLVPAHRKAGEKSRPPGGQFTVDSPLKSEILAIHEAAIEKGGRPK